MRLLIDTNVIMDYIAKRQPFVDDACVIIKLCTKKYIDSCISAHTITNLFFILRKELSIEKRKSTLLKLTRLFTIVGIDNEKLISSLKNDEFDDLEDCLQYECAKDFKADYIITRNTKDFENSSVKAIEPKDFIAILNI